MFFLDPDTGSVPPFAPTFAEPVHRLHPARRRRLAASTSSTTRMQNPTVQQFNLGTQVRLPGASSCASTSSTTCGTHFIIGRPIGEVFNPVVGGPDRVVNLESSVGTQLRRGCSPPSRSAAGAGSRCACPTPWRAPATTRTTTRSRSATGPIDPNDLEQGVRPDARTSSATGSCSPARSSCPVGLRLSPHLDARLRRAHGHPDARRARAACPTLPRNAGGRRVQDRRRAQRLHHRAERERRDRRRAAAPRVATTRASTTASTRSTCGSRGASRVGARARLEAIVECFNVFNVTNILGRLEVELLRVRERARARQLGPDGSRLPALVLLRPAP